jgi:protein-S-isoprenylcysteine O-methyltransferase Ste14
MVAPDSSVDVGTTSDAPGQSKASVDWFRLASKTCLCTVYVLFAVAHLHSLREQFRLSVALLVAFETLMVAMVVARRDSSATDRRPLVVLIGLAGSFAGLALRPVEGATDHLVWQIIQVAGVLLQIGASLSLGRSFGLIPANRGIRTGGLYRVVRHPFYLAYLVCDLGYVLNNPSLPNAFVLAAGTAFQVARVRYEEQLLLQSNEYAVYTTRVRWHLVPGIW